MLGNIAGSSPAPATKSFVGMGIGVEKAVFVLYDLMPILIPILMLMAFSAPVILIIIALVRAFSSPEPKGSLRWIGTIIDVTEKVSYDSDDSSTTVTEIPTVQLVFPNGTVYTEEAKVASHVGAGNVPLYVGAQVTVCYMPGDQRNHRIKILSQAYLDKKSGKTKGLHREQMEQAKALRRQREEQLKERFRRR